jgi:protein SCO1/2
VALLGLLLASGCFAQLNTPVEQLDGLKVDEKAGEYIDPDLTFINESGRVVRLGDLFAEGKPVLLTLVYYNCPMLCNLVLNGQTDAMRKIPQTPGEDYTVITISIDPVETPALAREKKTLYLSNYDRPVKGWHFLTDHEGNVKKLADQIGFEYRYDERIKQYAHPAVITFLSPKAMVARYLYGIKFKPLDLRLALAEAAESKFEFSTEQILLLCYHFDPQEGSYVPFAMNFMRGGGILVMLLLGIFIYRLRKAERKNGGVAIRNSSGMRLELAGVSCSL